MTVETHIVEVSHSRTELDDKIIIKFENGFEWQANCSNPYDSNSLIALTLLAGVRDVFSLVGQQVWLVNDKAILVKTDRVNGGVVIEGSNAHTYKIFSQEELENISQQKAW